MIRPAAFLLALTITLAACASSAGGAAPATARRGSSNLITAAELDQPALRSLSLYDAIQRLRPSWLRQRGATSVMNNNSLFPEVMVNDARSSIDALAGLRPSDVTSVEFMSAADATTQYGTGYVNGLIKVHTGSLR
jgi:hypothetical protein